MKQLLVQGAGIGLVAHGQIQPAFFVHDGFFMGKCVKARSAMIGAHTAFADTAEAHFAGGKVNDGIGKCFGENPGTFRKAGYDQQRLPYRDEEQIRWWFTVQSAQVWSCGRHYYQGSVPRQGGGIVSAFRHLFQLTFA